MADAPPTLRDQIVAILSSKPPSRGNLPIVVPDTLDHDVLRWGYEFGCHHMLLHVRKDVAVGWNVMTTPPGARRPRAPLPFASSITAWLASITEVELASVQPDRPMAFIERPPIPECAFAGFGIIHPSVAEHGVFAGDTLIPSCTFVVFPCHRSEVAREMDVEWATVQGAHVNWSNLERERSSAARAVRYPRPKKKATTPQPREPIRPRDAKLYVGHLGRNKDWVEIENWDRRVLRLADRSASILPDGPTRALSGRGDAEALLAAFLDDNRFLEQPGPKDAFVDLIAQIEATCGDVEADVEPIFLEERATGTLVARLWVKTEGRTLAIEYALLDPRLDETHVVDLVKGPYLHVYTGGWYRDKVDTLRLSPRDGGSAREVPYGPRR